MFACLLLFIEITFKVPIDTHLAYGEATERVTTQLHELGVTSCSVAC